MLAVNPVISKISFWSGDGAEDRRIRPVSCIPLEMEMGYKAVK